MKRLEILLILVCILLNENSNMNCIYLFAAKREGWTEIAWSANMMIDRPDVKKYLTASETDSRHTRTNSIKITYILIYHIKIILED